MIAKAATLFATVAFILPLGAQNYPLGDEPGIQFGWASEAFATNLRADGMLTFEEAEEEILFQLGAFRDGFNPATSDPSQWQDHWVVLQTATYDPFDQQVIATATLTGNEEPFFAGGQIWVWAFNSIEYAEDSEWLLVAPTGWHWPDVSSVLPVTYSLSDALPEDAVFGAINGSGFHLRLQQAMVIPEPALAMLSSIGFLLLLRRRRCV